MKTINLLTTSYIAPAVRMCELIECLERNLENRYIHNVHIAVEDPEEVYHKDAPEKLKKMLAHPKITVSHFGHRVTYRELFLYANQNLSGQIVMVSNADIWFEQSISHLLKAPLEGVLVCLSRDDRSNVAQRASVSQDTWIFLAPIKTFDCDWFLGPRGSDNKLAYAASKAGLKLINPCLAIRAVHVHRSNYRVGATTKKLPGPYLGVPRCALSELINSVDGTSSLEAKQEGPQGAFPKSKPESTKPSVKPKGPFG